MVDQKKHQRGGRPPEKARGGEEKDASSSGIPPVDPSSNHQNPQHLSTPVERSYYAVPNDARKGAHRAPVKQTPSERAPLEKAPMEKAPLEKAPLDKAPEDRAPAEHEQTERQSQHVSTGALPLTKSAKMRSTGSIPVIHPSQTDPIPDIHASQTDSIDTVLPDEQNEQLLEQQSTMHPTWAAGARSVIIFERVTKSYSPQQRYPALNNISLEIHPSEFVFLVGHSGSGKSTFIRLLNRELVATSGKIFVAGEELTRMRRWRVPYLRRNIGCVYQDFKLLPNKTAFQNVAFALEVIGKSKHIIRTQVPEVLRLVGLEDKIDKYPDQLSGGEQQRVSIARAIVNRPPLLICDEPTGNLDPQTSLGIMRLLDRINRTGTTIVVATHDREMVDSMRKRVVALENGYLIRDQHKGVYGEDA